MTTSRDLEVEFQWVFNKDQVVTINELDMKYSIL